MAKKKPVIGYKKLKNVDTFDQFDVRKEEIEGSVNETTEIKSGVRTDGDIYDTIWSLFNYTDLYGIDIKHNDITNIKLSENDINKLSPLINKFKDIDEQQAILLGEIFKIVIKK